MSVFNGERLDKRIFQIDSEMIRQGSYSDAYFCNIEKILHTLAGEGYVFSGRSDLPEIDGSTVATGDVVVEMQFFTRRRPFSLVAGIDEALAILEECTGCYDEGGIFHNTSHMLEIEALQDGDFVSYEGDPMAVKPVLKVRGRYRDFARLETAILGVLTEATRVATNVYNVLVAARGKDILFFPARFAHYKLQPVHGYAYHLAVQAYNRRYNKSSRAVVSTDRQGAWWGGKGGGTIAHASIACFMGDAAETMMQFARIMPVEVPRIALVDFHNDCVGDTVAVMKKMFAAFWELYISGRKSEADMYRLFAVRLDTSGDLRDVSVPVLGEKKLDCGVNPRLVFAVRRAIDTAYLDWGIPPEAREVAGLWCKNVKIVVTGGFNVKKINWFEDEGVPVDIYGVGSSLLENCGETGSNNDFTADIVRVKAEGKWHPICKVGRTACDNPGLQKIRKNGM